MASSRDGVNKTKHVVELLPALQAGDPPSVVDPDGADTKEASAVQHIVTIGAPGDTLSGTVYIELILEDSADDSTWAAVTSTDEAVADYDAYATPVAGAGLPDSSGIFQTIDIAGEASKAYRISYVGAKRYSRVRPLFTGTHTNGTIVGVEGILSMLDRSPSTT